MAKKTIPPKKLDPRWFSVVVWVHAPHLTTEVQLLEFPIPAQTKSEAVGVVRQTLMTLFYNPKTEIWRVGGEQVYPWHVVAVPYPQFISDMLTAELFDDDAPTEPTEVVRGKILQLFPTQQKEPTVEPGDSDP